MKKIVARIIHLLGGHTNKEFLDYGKKEYEMGRRTVLLHIHNEMKRINGVDADQWCRHMYQSVKMQLEDAK